MRALSEGLISFENLKIALDTFLKNPNYFKLNEIIDIVISLSKLEGSFGCDSNFFENYLVKVCNNPLASNLDIIQSVKESGFAKEHFKKRFPTKLIRALNWQNEVKIAFYGKEKEVVFNGRQFKRSNRGSFFYYKKPFSNEDYLFLLPKKQELYDFAVASANTASSGPSEILPGSVGFLRYVFINGNINITSLQGCFNSKGDIPVKKDKIKKHTNFKELLIDEVIAELKSHGLKNFSISFNTFGLSKDKVKLVRTTEEKTRKILLSKNLGETKLSIL